MPVVPVRSLILARSAAMSRAQQEESGPEVVFAWAGRLLPGEIAAIGRVVQQMLDDGAPNDVARGFGIAWTGGVKLPSGELEGMFKEFVDLQLTVASVLSGQDLRDLPPLPSATGLGGILHGWFGRPNPVSREADTVIERAGRNGQLALVALWNAWVGLRYRPLMPAATFEQLLHPWITVVGPVPEG
jgi:hypothetical protein